MKKKILNFKKLSLGLALTAFSISASSQDVITDTIVFTEITLDMGSPFFTYKDSKGVSHSDLVFKEEDIIVSDKVLCDYDDGILIEFDENFAKQLIGKKILRIYHIEDNGYFKAPMVHKLTIL